PLLLARSVRHSLRRVAAVLVVFALAGTFLAGSSGPAARAAPVTTNFPVHADFRPNDPYYVDQWGLRQIGAPNAWDVTLGAPSVVVAVVDTGVWWTHRDLQANMWTNPTDGSHGYDFIDGDTNPMDNDPQGIYHGTRVSGAAIDETGQKAAFSNYGSGLDLAAPGDRILTLIGNDQVHYLRGTSFAAPFVTAAAALLLSVDPNLTNVELWNILNSTAVQPGGGSAYNTDYGWGVVNAWNAINALSQPFISVNAYPTSVSRSSTFGGTWS